MCWCFLLWNIQGTYFWYKIQMKLENAKKINLTHVQEIVLHCWWNLSPVTIKILKMMQIVGSKDYENDSTLRKKTLIYGYHVFNRLGREAAMNQDKVIFFNIKLNSTLIKVINRKSKMLLIRIWMLKKAFKWKRTKQSSFKLRAPSLPTQD